MKRGDILVLYSRFDPASILITLFTGFKWTHSTMILDTANLLESVGKGIKVSPIAKYRSKLGKFRFRAKLYRLKDVDSKTINKVIKHGLELQKTRKYRSFIWSLLLIGLKKRTPTCQMSCSGFISYILSREGIYLYKTKDPLDVVPGDIPNSKQVIDVTDEL